MIYIDAPMTTEEATISSDTHPFANLLLVSLIILGFCVFVAWYAKKNQITADKGDEDDSGYLWGLNKASSPSSSEQIGDGFSNHKKGKSRHKKLLNQFDDDELDQQMNIQMTMNANNHNDLLAITPDHVGRLQTRVPNQMAPSIPSTTASKKQKKRGRKTKRKGKGGKFSRLQDDDDEDNPDFDEASDDDSSSGEDMMKMRDQYMASQTFSKKLADTLGDIHDTVKETAQAMKNKLTTKEPTVVRPMQMGSIKQQKLMKEKERKQQNKKRQPFTMVEDNETTDGFDFGDSSESTQENEYREDSETEIRVNIHGKRIKQPMKLPTRDSSDEEEEEELNIKKSEKKKKKKRDKKKKKKKKDKEKKQISVTVEQKDEEEVDQQEQEEQEHNINITVNNDENMGFGTDELAESDHMVLTKDDDDDMELTHDDVTMTMNELAQELMNSAKNNEDKIIDGDNNKVDLSFMDVVDSNTNNNNNDDDVDVINQVQGNGNVPHEN